MHRAVFLDRDGVLNRMVYHPEFGLVDSPANPDEFELLPRASESIREINQMGLLAVVVSNQPGVAKGKFTLALLQAMTHKLTGALQQCGAALDGIYYCLHHPNASAGEYRVNCACRKPEPGLLLRAAADLGIDLAGSYMVGDGVSDMVAGQTVGSRTLFVGSPKCYLCAELERQKVKPDYVAADLYEAIQIIGEIEEVGGRGLLPRPGCLPLPASVSPAREQVSL